MYNNEDYEEEEQEQETSSGNKWRDLYENNKKLILTLGIILVAILLLSLITGKGSSNNNTQEVEVLITYRGEEFQTKEISKNNTISFEAEVKGVKNSIVRWTSSNPEVAGVSSNGLVTGISLGTTNITATYDNNGKEVSKTVEVKVSEGNPNVQLEDAYFPKGDWLMGLGTSANLKLSITPTLGYIQNRTFTSSNPSIVSVDDDGTIKALALGNAKITASINNGRFTPSVMVYVLDEITIATQTTLVNEIKFSSTVVKIKEGEAYPLTYIVEPTNGDMTRVTWKSDNESSVTVTSNGIVNGIKEGSAIIKAYSITGAVLGSVHVNVEKDIIDVSTITVLGSSNPQITLLVRQSQPIEPVVKPDDASNKSLTFESSNPSVVSVSTYSGVSTVLNANSVGQATITIKSNNGQSCIMNVTVIDNSGGGNSNGGYSGGGSGSLGSGNCPNKNYKLRSYDSNGNGFMNCENLESAQKEASNGKVTVEVLEWGGSTNKLKICTYKYGTSPCDPDKNPLKSLTKGGDVTFAINEDGLWAIKISEYNGSTKVGSTYTWYANVSKTSASTSCYNYITSSTCANANCYWYNNSCHSEASSTPTPTPGNGTIKISSWTNGGTGTVNAGIFDSNHSVIFKNGKISSTGNEQFSIFYCVSDKGGGSCTPALSASASPVIRTINGQSGTCTSGLARTHYVLARNITESYSTKFCFDSTQTVCFKAKSSSGTTYDLGCKTF